MDWCDVSCLLSYNESLTAGEVVIAHVGVFIIMMLGTVCHEAGHYYAGKLCGLECIEFELGRGPVILRKQVTPAGCQLVLRLLPAGGQVSYDDRYWTVSYAGLAFMSAAGWLADVFVAIIGIGTAYLIGATGPISTVVCFVLALRVAYNLLPITSDGKKTAQYLWLAARERAHAQK